MSGVFVLSLDVEIAWGTFDRNGLVKYKKHFDNYRELIRKLTLLMDRYQIAATWAFVGHLMLDSCDGVHQEVLRPQYSWYGNEDWHKLDPGTTLEKDPFWYGSDVLEKVRGMNTKQEIGTHTFSHVVLGDPECGEMVALSQIKACVELASRYGIEVKSLVFPRNHVGHLDVLRTMGIKTYRGTEENWYTSFPVAIRRACRILDNGLAITPPTYPVNELTLDRELLNLPASQFLMPYDGIRKVFPTSMRVAKAKKGIRKAAEENGLFHMWFHPFNLGSSPEMFRALEAILLEVNHHRDNGKLCNYTMGDLYDLIKTSDWKK